MQPAALIIVVIVVIAIHCIYDKDCSYARPDTCFGVSTTFIMRNMKLGENLNRDKTLSRRQSEGELMVFSLFESLCMSHNGPKYIDASRFPIPCYGAPKDWSKH